MLLPAIQDMDRRELRTSSTSSFGRGRGPVNDAAIQHQSAQPGFGRQSRKPPAVGTPYRVSINCRRTR